MINKIFDCVTFFQENLLTNIRFEILNEVVDYFVICESKYDHRGNKKDLNFNLIDSKFKEKVIYIALEQPFKKKIIYGKIKQNKESAFLKVYKKLNQMITLCSQIQMRYLGLNY